MDGFVRGVIMQENCRVSELLLAALERIEKELERVYWNYEQKEYQSPFRNTGNELILPRFQVRAYDWGHDFWDEEDEYQECLPNFKWRDFEVRWYKHLNRGPYINRNISPKEMEIMLDDCLEAISELEDYLEEQEEKDRDEEWEWRMEYGGDK